MLPITAFLAASILARPEREDRSDNPGFRNYEKDDQVSFGIPRTPQAYGNFDKFYNTTDQSLFLTKLSDRKVVIVSVKRNGQNTAAILRISNVPHPRFGVEWARNQSFINGDSNGEGKRYGADTMSSVRFIGMHEVNNLIKNVSSSAARYLFSEMDWSGFTTTTTTNPDGSRIINLNTNATSNGLTFTFVIHVSDTPNAGLGVSPFGIKYDLHINGTPVYNLRNSHYRLINLIHNSRQSYKSLNLTGIDYGTTSYTWIKDVMVDGNPGLIESSTLINQTADIRWSNVGKGQDHDSSIDSYASKVILGFDIPKFTSSFSWDPTVMVDDGKASEEFGSTQASGAMGTGSWVALVVAAVLLL